MKENAIKNMKDVRHKTFVIVIIAISVVVFAFGMYIALFPIEKWGVKFSNDGFVSAVFSLIGAVLFFGALVYQIKEYQNQLKELKLSVEAQTASSVALKEQKEIMLQANNRELILSLIDKLIEYKNSDSFMGMAKNTFSQCFSPPYKTSFSTYSKPTGNDNALIDKELNSYFDIFRKYFYLMDEDTKFILRGYAIQIEGILNLINETKQEDEKITLTHLLMSNMKPYGITFYLSWRMNKMSSNNISFEWQKTATATLFKYMLTDNVSYQITPELYAIWVRKIDEILKRMFKEQGMHVIYEEKDLRNIK